MRSISLLLLVITLLPARPLIAAAPSDLAPPDTIFYSEVPSIPIFYELFLKYHQASILAPMVAKAMTTQVQPLLAERSPVPFTVPMALDANAALYSVVETNLFMAAVADAAGALTFVSGGVSPAPDQSAAKLRGMIEAKLPGLVWRNETIEKASVAIAEVPGVGSLFLTSAGTWLFFGTSRPALEHALRAIDNPIPGLSSTEIWKISTEKRPANTQLFYFTRLEAYAELAEKQKRPDIAQLFKTRLSGLRAFSWSWASSGPGSLAEDKMSYTFTPASAKAFGEIVSPLGTGWRGLAGPNTTVLSVFKFDAAALAAAPALKGFAITSLLETTAKSLGNDASPVHGAWIADFDPETQQPMSAVAVRADEKIARAKLAELSGKPYAAFRDGVWFLTETDAESTYFQNRKPGPSPVILEQSDKMAGVPDPFLEIRFDRQAAVRNYAARLKKNYANWLPILAERGVDAPKTFPDTDLDSFFGPLRSTFGLDGDNLVIDNAFQLGKSTGSTLITAQTQLLQATYSPEFSAMFRKCDELLSAAADTTTPSFFSICFKSNFIVSALFQPNQESLFTDVVSACFMGIAPDLERSK